jgi:3-oxoadipate enol-lactonase
MTTTERRRVRGLDFELAVHLDGPTGGTPIVLTHSILSSSMMWTRQAQWLAAAGMRVIRIDARGHGDSDAPSGPYTMDQLSDDTVAVLDALAVPKAHYVGLSLGGMSGFGLGLRHANRLLSLTLCDSRADAPPPVAQPWDERIQSVRTTGSCDVLADSTLERWFGRAFLDANASLADAFRATAATTKVDGFVGCARAIQGLAYLDRVEAISVPTTFIVGANDGVLPDANRELQRRVANSALELVPDAGHLPNIDQPAAFDAALRRHLQRIGALS